MYKTVKKLLVDVIAFELLVFDDLLILVDESLGLDLFIFFLFFDKLVDEFFPFLFELPLLLAGLAAGYALFQLPYLIVFGSFVDVPNPEPLS